MKGLAGLGVKPKPRTWNWMHAQLMPPQLRYHAPFGEAPATQQAHRSAMWEVEMQQLQARLA